ncbi:nucleotide sugar dehydrogenase [Halorubrum sp. SD626R]|uniref:nucleotide sugar dehydrogenase n=1 Tax=Halorubrum sp. SD626R TaxID=1419722 RepID=UPI000A5EF5F0|nr:nucleotide sugar dehydrogenase [Halorubrum sp. SD626R]TKX82261.1 nucleotide sugar dehydrogenase [Halorubrum sp. SD626R]
MKIYDSDLSENTKRTALLEGEIPVAVYGLGKMGLPLTAVYADVTGNVRGVDIDPEVVETVNNGQSPFVHEPGLNELVAETVANGSLRATTDSESAASEAAVHVIIVPTLVTKENKPDLSTVRSVVSDIATGIDAGDLVIVESTVPPRTCADVVAPLIEKESDLNEGEFGVAFCPERTKSGRALKDIRGSYPKVVGGIDAMSTNAAVAIYKEITDNDVVTVSDITTAEAVKLFEGVYRDVNIALVNELARFVDETGIDVLEAIDVANDSPYIDLHNPGAGVGGHCIPYYPYFLIEQFETPGKLMRTARKINDSMPAFTVDKLLEGLNAVDTQLSNASIAVLGVTYDSGIPETRHTPAKPIIERLAGQGANVYGVDPVIEDLSEFKGATPTTVDELYDIGLDAAVLVTAHEAFEDIAWDKFDDLVIVDGRDAINIETDRHWLYTIGSGQRR